MVGIHVGGTEVSGVHVGASPVAEVYVGTTKVWPTTPPFARQRMNKSGNWSTSAGDMRERLTGWASDPAYPATITNNQLTITGGGTVTISGTILTAALTTFQVIVMHNNTDIWTSDVPGGTHATEFALPSVTVADGDTITIDINRLGPWAIQVVPERDGLHTYVDVNPTG